jgi:hypothetical protein
VVFAFEVVPALDRGTPPTGPTTLLVLGALSILTVAFVPGGLAGAVRRLVERFAPAAQPSAALVGVAGRSGFTAVREERDPFGDDPYAIDDPFADDYGDPFEGPFGDGNGHGHGDARDG